MVVSFSVVFRLLRFRDPDGRMCPKQFQIDKYLSFILKILRKRTSHGRFDKFEVQGVWN